MDTTGFEQYGLWGLVAMLLIRELIPAVKAYLEKRNGGTQSDKVKRIEHQIGELTNSIKQVVIDSAWTRAQLEKEDANGVKVFDNRGLAQWFERITEALEGIAKVQAQQAKLLDRLCAGRGQSGTDLGPG